MISRAGFERYNRLVTWQGEEAVSKIKEFASRLKWGDTTEDRAFARELLHDYAYDVVCSYGDTAAEIAARYYDSLAELAGADVPSAVLAKSGTAAQVSSSVDYATRSVWDAGEGGELKPVDSSKVGEAVSRMVGGRVRRMANETMRMNAERDHARYARVTTSAHPCAFCLMLASRGFAYCTEESAIMSHNMTRYHDDCHCIAVASFDDEGLEGYGEKVEEYSDMWKAASDSLSDMDTRAAWNELSPEEQAKYQRPDHPTWNGYANYRTHMLMSQMREMYGIEK